LDSSEASSESVETRFQFHYSASFALGMWARGNTKTSHSTPPAVREMPNSHPLWGKGLLRGTSGLRGQGELGTAWAGKPGQDKPSGASGPRRRKLEISVSRRPSPVAQDPREDPRGETLLLVPGPRRTGWGGTATRKAWFVAALDVPPPPPWTGGRAGRSTTRAESETSRPH